MVYHFKWFNGLADEAIIPPLKSTAERIKKIRCEVIEESGEDVPISALDAEGRYNPDGLSSAH